MKPLTIAFLHNVRHVYPDPDDPRSQLEVDFDDPITIKWMIRHFKSCGYRVIPIEADDKAYLTLASKRKQIDLAFNYSEGITGRDREAQLPAMLEMLQIPYLGCRPLAAALVLDKAMTKRVLQSHGIATPEFQVIDPANPKEKCRLPFPLMVKPLNEGSSAGINNKSLVHNAKELKQQLEFVFDTFNQPAMLERFLSGREFSVPMIGNPPEILPFIESRHSLLPKHLAPIDSLEVKWFYEEQAGTNHLVCPASISKTLRAKIEKLCRGAWDALYLRDWCRMDIRYDEKENPYFLEVNVPAGLLPPEVSLTSYMPLSARQAGLDYEALLNKLVRTAAVR